MPRFAARTLFALALVLASGRFSAPPEPWPATSQQGASEDLCEQSRTDAGERPDACRDHCRPPAA